MKQRKVVDARADTKRNIEAVKLDGNSNFTSVEVAMRMADAGQLENSRTMRRENARPHLRTNADGREGNNLDDMAGDK